MDLVYARESLPAVVTRSIFLAGPTPRGENVGSWRPAAIAELERQGFDGAVYIPEDRSGVYHGDYDHQVAWEEEFLERADVVLFWVPRSLPNMPAFTTNVEWGRWKYSGKAVLGTPPEGERNDYLVHYATQLGIPQSDTLAESCALAIAATAEAPREGVERDLPAIVWTHPWYQTWRESVVMAEVTRLRVDWLVTGVDYGTEWSVTAEFRDGSRLRCLCTA
jgi:Nucleoside 2-deoxyribosyltransferase like